MAAAAADFHDDVDIRIGRCQRSDLRLVPRHPGLQYRRCGAPLVAPGRGGKASHSNVAAPSRVMGGPRQTHMDEKILITGAARGLGLAMTRELLGRGCHVAVLVRAES